MRCTRCRGQGFVVALAVEPPHVRATTPRLCTVRVACAWCDAGRRWYAVRKCGCDVAGAPESWSDAIVLILRENPRTFRDALALARVMELPPRFVRERLLELINEGRVKAPRSMREEDQASEDRRSDGGDGAESESAEEDGREVEEED